MANVSLVAKVANCATKLQEVADGIQEMGQVVSNSPLQLAKSLKNMTTSIESLCAGVNHRTSQIGGLKGEAKQIREQVKWALKGRSSAT